MFLQPRANEVNSLPYLYCCINRKAWRQSSCNQSASLTRPFILQLSQSVGTSVKVQLRTPGIGMHLKFLMNKRCIIPCHVHMIKVTWRFPMLQVATLDVDATMHAPLHVYGRHMMHVITRHIMHVITRHIMHEHALKVAISRLKVTWRFPMLLYNEVARLQSQKGTT